MVFSLFCFLIFFFEFLRLVGGGALFIKSVSCMKYSLINKKLGEKPQTHAAVAQFHSFNRPLNNAEVFWFFVFGLICAPEICHHNITIIVLRDTDAAD